MLWHRRRQWREDAPIYAHLATFAAISAVLWAQTSHRSYLDVYLIVFAAGMLDRVWERCGSARVATGSAQNSSAERQDMA